MAIRGRIDDDAFGIVALEVHRFQLRYNTPYARWCRTLPDALEWRGIPAVPQAMFKRFRLSCFPARLTPVTFRTSGTTGETRGEHHFADTALYEAAIRAGWQRLRLRKMRALFLAQHPREAPDSSLTHMFGVLAKHAAVEPVFALRPTTDALGRLADSGPCALFGTALAFLSLFERMGDASVRFARGSFALETGGYKGTGRDIPKHDLYAMFRTRLGLRADDIWNEYGMTELSSQAYTRGLGRVHETPPWMRALVIDPGTGEEVAVGATGVLRLFDLANVGSVLAIQTADLAVRRTTGFELLGRDPAAIPRGCSRRADELLGGVKRTLLAAAPTPQARPSGNSSLQTAASAALPGTAERARALAEAAAAFPFLGKITARGLLALVESELGHAAVLDRFVARGGKQVRAVAPRRILHILSRNTPAAALQTILRGLLLGSENFCKLPSAGIPEVAEFRARLPLALAERLHVSRDLPDGWFASADAAVVFGRDETVAAIAARLPRGIPFIAHGHRLSLAIVFHDPALRSVRGAARDVSIFDQQGCLSPHVIFIRERVPSDTQRYAAALAGEMARFEKKSPRAALATSEANSIRTLRDECAFLAANGGQVTAFASEDTAWTVIADRTPGLPLSPLNRVIFVKPLPPDLPSLLAPHRTHLSTCGIWPATDANRDLAAAHGFTRICPIGKMQSPPADWHHDGQQVLAPLVRWVDCEK